MDNLRDKLSPGQRVWHIVGWNESRTLAAVAGLALRNVRPVLRCSCRSPSIKLSLAHASQTSTGTRRSWPVPTERPAAARRYSFAFEEEQLTAHATSSALTHAVMPAGSARSGAR